MSILTAAPPHNLKDWKRATGIGSLASASKLVAGLSAPGKMPCHSYGLPAAECNVGSKLRAASTDARPTVCGGCYALKGSYRMYPEVIPAQYRRLASVQRALASADAADNWVGAMVALIGWRERESKVFRWHDSGDLQSVEHLTLIVRVADALPWIRFWLPTREAGVLGAWLKANGALPANLTVRQSAALVDHFPRADRAQGGRTFSAVAKNAPGPDGAHACPAYRQSGECRSCRACWDADVPVVVYPLH